MILHTFPNEVFLASSKFQRFYTEQKMDKKEQHLNEIKYIYTQFGGVLGNFDNILQNTYSNLKVL